jgi:hypothetical protein
LDESNVIGWGFRHALWLTRFKASKLPSPQQCASKRWPRSSLEQISQVIVQEPARRVHPATDRLEIMKARIERRHVFRAIEMQLAPMRSRSVFPEDRVDVEEIVPIVDLRPPETEIVTLARW